MNLRQQLLMGLCLFAFLRPINSMQTTFTTAQTDTTANLIQTLLLDRNGFKSCVGRLLVFLSTEDFQKLSILLDEPTLEEQKFRYPMFALKYACGVLADSTKYNTQTIGPRLKYYEAYLKGSRDEQVNLWVEARLELDKKIAEKEAFDIAAHKNNVIASLALFYESFKVEADTPSTKILKSDITKAPIIQQFCFNNSLSPKIKEVAKACSLELLKQYCNADYKSIKKHNLPQNRKFLNKLLTETKEPAYEFTLGNTHVEQDFYALLQFVPLEQLKLLTSFSGSPYIWPTGLYFTIITKLLSLMPLREDVIISPDHELLHQAMLSNLQYHLKFVGKLEDKYVTAITQIVTSLPYMQKGISHSFSDRIIRLFYRFAENVTGKKLSEESQDILLLNNTNVSENSASQFANTANALPKMTDADKAYAEYLIGLISSHARPKTLAQYMLNKGIFSELLKQNNNNKEQELEKIRQRESSIITMLHELQEQKRLAEIKTNDLLQEKNNLESRCDSLKFALSELEKKQTLLQQSHKNDIENLKNQLAIAHEKYELVAQHYSNAQRSLDLLQTQANSLSQKNSDLQVMLNGYHNQLLIEQQTHVGIKRKYDEMSQNYNALENSLEQEVKRAKLLVDDAATIAAENKLLTSENHALKKQIEKSAQRSATLVNKANELYELLNPGMHKK